MCKEEQNLKLKEIKEYREILREQIQHEDTLYNQRLTWFLVTQGFLFSAFAQILKIEEKLLRVAFIILIGIFGFYVGKAIEPSIIAANKAVIQLVEDWKKKFHENEREQLPPLIYTLNENESKNEKDYLQNSAVKTLICINKIIWILIVLFEMICWSWPYLKEAFSIYQHLVRTGQDITLIIG